MKLKFDPNQEYQLEAVNAVVDVFKGQPIGKTDFELSYTMELMNQSVAQVDFGIGNLLAIDDEALLNNIQGVQITNDIEKVPTLQGRNFSIEMETGTGKTYVYLRTIFEIKHKYGFKKYIIVVPSVAIREGTLKNLEITKNHFKQLYNNVPFDYYVYDSKKINVLRQYATSNQIQILIMNIDAFRKTMDDTEDEKKSNVIHRENDRLSGRKPIDFIKGTNPIVIIDEPQNMESDKAKSAVDTLNPMCTLRYSATHKNPYNLLYKLDPIRAYAMRLVKRIEVASVLSEDSFNSAFVKLLEVDNAHGIRAKVAFHANTANTVKEMSVWMKNGDDIHSKSNEREVYRDGFIISEICAEPDNEYVTFNNGREIRLGESQGDLKDDIMRLQIRNTIEEHLKKELLMKNRGIKVLTLFFIDKVANYRSYDKAR